MDNLKPWQKFIIWMFLLTFSVFVLTAVITWIKFVLEVAL